MATWLFLDPWKKNSFLFDGIKPSLVSGSMSSQWKKKWLKMCFPPGVYFLQSPVIRAPTLLNRSYRHWQKLYELLENSHSLMSFVVRQGPQNKGIGYMRLNRLLSMTKIFMTFCLTYYWLLIFIFRYKKVILLKSLRV